MKVSLLMLILSGFVCANTMADDLPKANCKAPTIPSPMASEMVTKYFNKRMEEYKRCMNKFVDEQHELAKSTVDVTKANLAHDAAEVAIKEYNNFMDELNARNEKASAGEPEESQ